MARKASGKIKIEFTGFEDLVKEIEKASGKIENAVIKATDAAADVVYTELRTQAAAAGVPDSVTNEIKKTPATMQNNICTATVGWELGEYNPADPSAGYKAILMNYGTPRARRTRAGENRGTMGATHFIRKTKRRSKKKVVAAQKAALNETLKGLKK